MALFDEETKQSIKAILREMDGEVMIYYFERPNHELNPYYEEMLNVLEESSENIKIYRFKRGQDDKYFDAYNIKKTPCLQIVGKNKGIIRYCGLPSGYEFGTFLHDLVDASKGKSHLSETTKEYLEKLDKRLELMVFVTPQCPYCPQAVKLAHDFAMVSEKVVAEMINAPEFPQLSAQFRVQGVPHTVINNGEGEFVGAYPEDAALNIIKKVMARE